MLTKSTTKQFFTVKLSMPEARFKILRLYLVVTSWSKLLLPGNEPDFRLNTFTPGSTAAVLYWQ